MTTDDIGSNPLRSEPGSAAALWIGWIAAPAWWLAQFELRYAAISHACASGQRWLVAAIGVGALAVALGLAVWAAKRKGAGGPSSHFIRIGGAVLSGLFAGLVFMQILPDLFLDPCRR